MDWDSKLKELSNYNIAFEIKKGYYHVALQFKKDWDVIVPENEQIYLQEKNGIHHYVASIDCVNVDDIFNAIQHTINYNKDLEKKLDLFREKTAELQELFSKETYEKLKTLEFTFPLQKKTSKKARKIKKTESNVVTVTDKVNPTTTSITNENEGEVVVTMKEGEFFEELEREEK